MTTNFQLMEYGKKFKIPNFYVLMRDELTKVKISTNTSIIINLHKSNQEGVHWSCLHLRDNIAIFFDSFGLQPTNEIIEFCKQKNIKELHYSNYVIQKPDEKNCGQLCLYVLKELSTCQKDNLLNHYFKIILEKWQPQQAIYF